MSPWLVRGRPNDLLLAYPTPLRNGTRPAGVQEYALPPANPNGCWRMTPRPSIPMPGKGGIPLQHSFMTREEYEAIFSPPRPPALASASSSSQNLRGRGRPAKPRARPDHLLQIADPGFGNNPPVQPNPQGMVPPVQPQQGGNPPPAINFPVNVPLPAPAQPALVQQIVQTAPPPPPAAPIPDQPANPNPPAAAPPVEADEPGDWRARNHESNFYFCQDCHGFWVRAQVPYFELRRAEVLQWMRQHEGYTTRSPIVCDTCRGTTRILSTWTGITDITEFECQGSNRDTWGEWVYVGGRTIVLRLRDMPNDSDPMIKVELHRLRNAPTPAYCEHRIDQWVPETFFTYDAKNRYWDRRIESRRDFQLRRSGRGPPSGRVPLQDITAQINSDQASSSSSIHASNPENIASSSNTPDHLITHQPQQPQEQPPNTEETMELDNVVIEHIPEEDPKGAFWMCERCLKYWVARETTYCDVYLDSVEYARDNDGMTGITTEK